MKHKSSLFLKIALTLSIAVAMVLLSWRLTEFNFKKISEPVGNLAESYAPLELVNVIFKDVISLDMLQRNLSGKAKKEDMQAFFTQTKKIGSDLDSLSTMISEHPDQLERITTMKGLLTQKLALFEQYIRLNHDFKGNDSLRSQVDKLTTFISKESITSKPKATKILKETTNVKTTTVVSGDTLVEQKRNLWDKVWGRKKEPVKMPPILTEQVQEEKVVTVDTQLLKKDNKVMVKYGQNISQIESQRNAQLKQLNTKRVELDMAGSQLIQQFLITLNEIELAARADKASNNMEATHIIESGLKTNRTILITFMILSVALAAFIFNDIAKSNRYRKALVVAKEQADEAGQAKQKFLSNMSHEIRTPLQSIIGYTELVQREEDPENQKQFIKVVHQSSLHLLHIVNEILDYNRINSDKFVISTQAFNLLSIVDQVVEIIQIQAQRKQIKFETYTKGLDAQTMLYGDPFRLKQILLNLLNNAIKFTDHGSVTLNVKQEQVNGKFLAHFKVSDTGVGIPIADQERIFNEFEQAPTSQLQQGSGLGLSIVKALIDIQGGTIGLESTPYRGSTFTFSIPYALQGSANDDSDGENETIKKMAPKLVWVIDDDPFILELCAEVLRKHQIPHRTFSAADTMLNALIPDALNYVLMDIRMPEYSGMELVKLMKAKVAAHHNVQFIALTAQVLPEEVGDLFAAGFDTLVRKPFVVDELLHTIGLETIIETTEQDVLHSDPITALFKQETTADIAYLKANNYESRMAELSEVCHKLASRLSQLGYTAEGRVVRLQEMQLRKGKYDYASLESAIHQIERLV